MSGLKVLYYYKIALLKYLFGVISSPGIFNDSLNTNFHHPTFRFPQKAKTDLLISSRMYWLLMKSQFEKNNSINTGVNSNAAIFDANLADAELRMNYIERLDGEKIKLFIGRSELRKSTGFISSIVILLSCLLSFPFVFLVSVLSKNKLKAPLHLVSCVECFNLVRLLKKHNIKKLYFFCIYENDANLIAFILMKCSIEVSKIPSEVPLSFWNQTVVADTLNFCFRYQEDEFELHKKTMYVKQTRHWVPENAFNSEKVYKNVKFDIKKGTIGFYSSAMWLRAKLGQVNLNDNAYMNEQNLLKLLLGFISENSGYKLIVFLHPKEKENMEMTNGYYGSLSQNIEFADVIKPNAEQFFNADVAVTLFSTLAYERLFWGFKTLIYPLGKDHFPIKNSTFNTICSKVESELKDKLKAALEMDNETFFKNNGLTNYRYSNYPFFS